MKLKTLFGLLALLIAVITVQAVEPVQVQIFTYNAVEFVENHAQWAMALPVVAHAKVTPELVKELGLKYSPLKKITVVAEAAVYDIDELTPKDKANMRILGIDVSVVCMKQLDIKERLEPLRRLVDLYDNEEHKELAKALGAKYTGKVISEAEQYEFLVRRPDRGLIKMLLPLAEQGKIDAFSEKAVKNLVVGGEVDALDDGIVYMGVVSKLKEMIAPAMAFLSKA